tara:strand:- start:27193 stop:28044 length:852 start_codon:yes stop_codon:yes gene_type:complete
MSLKLRIISRLDIKGPNLVKGINFEGLRVLGDPKIFAKYYYEDGVDEILYQDTVASLYGRNSLKKLIEETVRDIFIPITVGGGIRSLEDIFTLLSSGADRVSINTAGFTNLNLLEDAVKEFGSSTIVSALEVIKDKETGKYMLFTDNGRNPTGRDVVSWAKILEEVGIGEIILTSVDNEGTGKGFDQDLIALLNDNISTPFIVHGGIGNKEQVLQAFKGLNLSSISCSSIFHYDFIKFNQSFTKKPSEGNTTFLKSSQSPSFIESVSPNLLKEFLKSSGLDCR